jgi:hypothetical protein
MRGDSLLKGSVAMMTLALLLMLVCLWRISAATMVLFLAVGLPLAAGSVAIFLLYVLRDLRARRAL